VVHYYRAYLKQLEIEGYNIFVIRGPLPDPVPDVSALRSVDCGCLLSLPCLFY
jgi:hypothetical protein